MTRCAQVRRSRPTQARTDPASTPKTSTTECWRVTEGLGDDALLPTTTAPVCRMAGPQAGPDHAHHLTRRVPALLNAGLSAARSCAACGQPSARRADACLYQGHSQVRADPACPRKTLLDATREMPGRDPSSLAPRRALTWRRNFWLGSSLDWAKECACGRPGRPGGSRRGVHGRARSGHRSESGSRFAPVRRSAHLGGCRRAVGPQVESITPGTANSGEAIAILTVTPAAIVRASSSEASRE